MAMDNLPTLLGPIQPLPTAAMTIAAGTAGVQPTAFGYYPVEGSRAISVQYDWTAFSAYVEDLSLLVARGVETTIQGCFIDNSTVAQFVSLTANGTGQVLTIPPYSQGLFPLFFTGTPGFTISIPISAAAVTRVILLNVPPQAVGTWAANPGASSTTGPFLPLAGGVLSGPLTLNGNATSPLQPVTLQQVQAGGLPYVPFTGTGPQASPAVSAMSGPFTSTNGGVTAPMTVVGDSYQNPNSWAYSNSTITIRADPYGYYDTGTLLSMVATGQPITSSRAGVNGGWEAGVSAIAGYGYLDSVNLYSGILSHEPPLVLHNVTYTATTIVPATALTAAQMALLRVNMYVLTNSIDTTVSATPSIPNGTPLENHYASYVVSWTSTAITVTGWTVPGSGHTAAGQVPSSTYETAWSATPTVYLGASTNVFGGNFVAQHNPGAYPDSRTRMYSGIEFDFTNYDTNNYTMSVNGISLIYSATNGMSLPTTDSTGFTALGFPTGVLIRSPSPPAWTGTPTHAVQANIAGYVDSNQMQLIHYISRDSATTGWAGASARLQLWIDSNTPVLSSGTAAAQIIWSPQSFPYGLALATGTGVAGLEMDQNGYLTLSQTSLTSTFYPHTTTTAALPASGAGGVMMASDAINPRTNTNTGPLLVEYQYDSTWRVVGSNQQAQTTAYTSITIAPGITSDNSGNFNLQVGALQVASTKVVGARVTGYGTPTGGVRTASFPGASATLAQTSAQLAQLILDLQTHGLLGA